MKDRRREFKKIKEEEIREEHKKRNEILNHNMLKEEEIWDVLLVAQEDKGLLSSSETNVTPKVPDPKSLAVEFVMNLQWQQKRSLFVNEFNFCAFSL